MCQWQLLWYTVNQKILEKHKKNILFLFWINTSGPTAILFKRESFFMQFSYQFATHTFPPDGEMTWWSLSPLPSPPFYIVRKSLHFIMNQERGRTTHRNLEVVGTAPGLGISGYGIDFADIFESKVRFFYSTVSMTPRSLT